MINVEDILHSISLADTIISSGVDLKQNGKEWKGCCPFHSEKTPSFTIFTGGDGVERYQCFGCDASGSVVDYTMKTKNLDFKGALADLHKGGNVVQLTPEQRESKKKAQVDPYEGWKIIKPKGIIEIGKEYKVANPKRNNTGAFIPTMVHPYKNTKGETIFYVLRRLLPEGKKEIPTICYARNPQGKEGWCRIRPNVPFPLYNRDLLVKHPKKSVLIVEGEKCADAGSKLLPSWCVISWIGGTSSWNKSKWEELEGRNITIMPDNDDVGERCAEEIGKHLQDIAASVRILKRDKELPKGWDIADGVEQGWKAKDFAAWAKAQLVEEQPEPQEEQQEEQPPAIDYGDMPDPVERDYSPPPEDVQVKKEVGFPDAPFKLLGYNRDMYYYMPTDKKQVVELVPAQHTKLHLLQLADLNWWRESFGLGEKSDLKVWENAANALIHMSHKAGIFDGDRVRGRGAWSDDGRSLLHCGDRIIIDGKVVDPKVMESKFIYEEALPLTLDITKVATTNQAHALLDVCKSLSWEKDISAYLLAGWCVIAPVCGVLKWRPHIWLTGAASSGKSTVMDDVIKKLLGNMALSFDSKTTEAGIRQRLMRDARPAVFDEAEAEDAKAANTMRGVLDLARLASSGGTVVKGSKDGKNPMIFSVRTCFCFSSINPSIKQYADETRITKLVLKKVVGEGVQESWKNLQSMIFETMTPEFSNKMLARSIKHLDVLLSNIEVFTEAAAITFGDRRTADQIGTMLAGAYLLHSAKKVTRKVAISWLVEQDWTMHTALDSAKDEERLVSHLATEVVKVKRSGTTGDKTLGELIEDTHKDIDGECQSARDLRRYGILVERNYGKNSVLIASTSRPLSDILKETPWSADWSRPLRQLEGAEMTTNTIYFSVGIKSRAVRIPINYFIDSDG